MSLRTPRLILREWRDEDLPLFAGLNADSRVMEFFPALLTREKSDEFANRIRAFFRDQGFGLWAVEVIGGCPFIGFVGLTIPGFRAHFTPCVEVGWRLAAEHWGQGYAPEAARSALAFGFATLKLEEIVSMTTRSNLKSRRVMEKIGMQCSAADDFGHPAIPDAHPLQPHVLYRLTKSDWERDRRDGISDAVETERPAIRMTASEKFRSR